eukprot:30135-Pelagococcus_subviridis.AAC.22
MPAAFFAGDIRTSADAPISRTSISSRSSRLCGLRGPRAARSTAAANRLLARRRRRAALTLALALALAPAPALALARRKPRPPFEVVVVVRHRGGQRDRADRLDRRQERLVLVVERLAHRRRAVRYPRRDVFPVGVGARPAARLEPFEKERALVFAPSRAERAGGDGGASLLLLVGRGGGWARERR